ncbi:Uncharacterised protein [Weissella viridescens]|uniref:Uncharacterized protein n=1 Tax=Weissella viridescens TaxID=1629 RepID=A0A380P870_WEIVI|nr:Uncharacterised protein [Weissella viridescens]
MGNDDLERQLEQWAQQIARSVNLTVEDQRKVTRAGAEAAKVVIVEETRKKHFESGRDTSKMAHLADSVVVGREERHVQMVQRVMDLTMMTSIMRVSHAF